MSQGALTKFTKFPKLPPELRLKIWAASIPEDTQEVCLFSSKMEWVRLDRDPEVLVQPPAAAHVNHEARSVALKRVTFGDFVDQASGARLRAACRPFRPELDVMLILPVLPASDDLELDRELAAYLNWVGHGGGFLGRVYRPEPSLDRPRPAAPQHLAVEVIQSINWTMDGTFSRLRLDRISLFTADDLRFDPVLCRGRARRQMLHGCTRWRLRVETTKWRHALRPCAGAPAGARVPAVQRVEVVWTHAPGSIESRLPWELWPRPPGPSGDAGEEEDEDDE